MIIARWEKESGRWLTLLGMLRGTPFLSIAMAVSALPQRAATCIRVLPSFDLLDTFAWNLSTSSSTIAVWPRCVAMYSAVRPIYINRITSVSVSDAASLKSSRGVYPPLVSRGKSPLYWPSLFSFSFPLPFLPLSSPSHPSPVAAARSRKRPAAKSILMHFSYKLSYLAKLQLLMMLVTFC